MTALALSTEWMAKQLNEMGKRRKDKLGTGKGKDGTS